MDTTARYCAADMYLREKFGEKVYRLLLSAGTGCPNRDGTVSTLGCSFCKGDNAAFSEAYCADAAAQVARAKARIKEKTDARKFIAYFGVGTATHGDVRRLETLFTRTLMLPDVVALSLGTRCDALDGEKIAMLTRLNQIKPVWVELGFQTANEATARAVNRGYPNDLFLRTVDALRASGIDPIAHLIFSLPGETRADMLRSVDFVADAGVRGVKIHMLTVLSGTPLEAEYRAGRVPLLSLEAYTDVLIEAIRRLPPDVVIHRFTGDGAKRDLVAPLWTADKKRVLNYIRKEFDRQQLRQGELRGAL